MKQDAVGPPGIPDRRATTDIRELKINGFASGAIRPSCEWKISRNDVDVASADETDTFHLKTKFEAAPEIPTTTLSFELEFPKRRVE